MHYLSCCLYSLNIFWAFQTACSGLNFSIQSHCLLFFLSSFPQNQYVDLLNSLQQATRHIYITPSHCLSSPISVSLVIEQKSQLQLLYKVVATLGHLLHIPTDSHRVSRSGNVEQTHMSLKGCMLGGMYCMSFCCGSDRICVYVWFYRETEHFKLLPGLGTDERLRAPPWAWHWEVAGRHTPSCASTLPSNGHASDSQVNRLLPFCLHCSRS